MCIRWSSSNFGFRICFGFRYSSFGFGSNFGFGLIFGFQVWRAPSCYECQPPPLPRMARPISPADLVGLADRAGGAGDVVSPQDVLGPVRRRFVALFDVLLRLVPAPMGGVAPV